MKRLRGRRGGGLASGAGVRVEGTAGRQQEGGSTQAILAALSTRESGLASTRAEPTEGGRFSPRRSGTLALLSEEGEEHLLAQA
ncbi:hypothetical protein NDU88_001238 [Pleurodeles waltl]|uniref:Uncharacterized protein n=1 Tax=Pleurodeles waltl TaxID=8319 RepID=A0AAV7VB36_PLEWA|nr:hypothetical protein NDU88_001238 [Pleurodeles waltl]